MTDDKKMLQMVLNGQSLTRDEMRKWFEKVYKKFDEVDKKFDEVYKKIDGTELRLTKRIDRIGLDLASLSDDTPTLEEFDKLEKKVSKIQKQAVIN